MGSDLDKYETNEEGNSTEQDVLNKKVNAFFEGFVNSIKKIDELLVMIDSSDTGPGINQKILLDHLKSQLIQSLDLLPEENKSDEKSRAIFKKAVEAADRTLKITIAALQFMGSIIRGVNLAFKSSNHMEEVFNTFAALKIVFNKYDPLNKELSKEEINETKTMIKNLLNEKNYEKFITESHELSNPPIQFEPPSDAEETLDFEELFPQNTSYSYYLNSSEDAAKAIQDSQYHFINAFHQVSNSEDERKTLRKAAQAFSDWRKAIKIVNNCSSFFDDCKKIANISLRFFNEYEKLSNAGIVTINNHVIDFYESLEDTVAEDLLDAIEILATKLPPDRLKKELAFIESFENSLKRNQLLDERDNLKNSSDVNANFENEHEVAASSQEQVLTSDENQTQLSDDDSSKETYLGDQVSLEKVDSHTEYKEEEYEKNLENHGHLDTVFLEDHKYHSSDHVVSNFDEKIENSFEDESSINYQASEIDLESLESNVSHTDLSEPINFDNNSNNDGAETLIEHQDLNQHSVNELEEEQSFRNPSGEKELGELTNFDDKKSEPDKHIEVSFLEIEEEPSTQTKQKDFQNELEAPPLTSESTPSLNSDKNEERFAHQATTSSHPEITPTKYKNLNQNQLEGSKKNDPLTNPDWNKSIKDLLTEVQKTKQRLLFSLNQKEPTHKLKPIVKKLKTNLKEMPNDHISMNADELFLAILKVFNQLNTSKPNQSSASPTQTEAPKINVPLQFIQSFFDWLLKALEPIIKLFKKLKPVFFKQVNKKDEIKKLSNPQKFKTI